MQAWDCMSTLSFAPRRTATAAGTDPGAASAAARRTTAFYTGESAGPA